MKRTVITKVLLDLLSNAPEFLIIIFPIGTNDTNEVHLYNI